MLTRVQCRTFAGTRSADWTSCRTLGGSTEPSANSSNQTLAPLKLVKQFGSTGTSFSKAKEQLTGQVSRVLHRKLAAGSQEVTRDPVYYDFDTDATAWTNTLKMFDVTSVETVMLRL